MRRVNVSRHAQSKLSQIGSIIKQILFVAVPIGILIWLPRQSFSQIQTIDCQVDNQNCDESTLSSLQLNIHKFVLGIQPKNIQAKLLENPLYESVEVNVRFPSTLEVSITTHKNLIDLGMITMLIATDSAQIITPVSTGSASPSASPHPIIREFSSIIWETDKYFLLTAKGTIIPSQKKDIQAWIVSDNGTISFSTDQLNHFYNLDSEFIRSGLNTDKVWLTNRWVGVKLKSGPLVVFDPFSDPLRSVTTLQQILAQATMDLTHVVLDLRFEKPVITENP